MERSLYYSRGNFEEKSETIHNPFTYFGQQFDESTGLYYLRGRYYDPATSRMLSEDPARDGLNWYVYCKNNPIRYKDPTGCISEDELKMFDDGKMAPAAYSYLMNLTYQYYLADTQESKNYYHKLAEDFRANNYATTNGESPTVDANIKKMDKLPTVSVTKEEHYFRNELNLTFSYNEIQTLNGLLPENLKWGTVIATYHQNHKADGKENIKYVSGDGHFEVVFNAYNEIQAEHNNPDDMGTYNYASPTKHPFIHTYVDVIPYNIYGNVKK